MFNCIRKCFSCLIPSQEANKPQVLSTKTTTIQVEAAARVEVAARKPRANTLLLSSGDYLRDRFIQEHNPLAKKDAVVEKGSRVLQTYKSETTKRQYTLSSRARAAIVPLIA
jgi:hypothetical protein